MSDDKELQIGPGESKGNFEAFEVQPGDENFVYNAVLAMKNINYENDRDKEIFLKIKVNYCNCL